MLSRVACGFLLVAAASAAAHTQTSPYWPYMLTEAEFNAFSYNQDEGVIMGQRHWNLTYPECGLPFQSPVNMRSSYTSGKKDRDLPDIEYQYTNNTNVFMHNNGKWLDVFTSPPDIACVFQAPAPSTDSHFHGGPLMEEYTLRQLTFKGGRKSEHRVNGNSKRLEIQFVHYKTSGFTSCTELDHSVHEEKGLAIMSVLVNRGKANIEIQKIIDAMNTTTSGFDLWKAGVPTPTAFNFSLAGILPKQYYKSFYTYQGSLTAPPCTQSVTWIVPKHYITMSADQLYFFTDILATADGTPIGDNYRLEHSMGPRMVSRSFGGSGNGNNNNLPFGGLGLAGGAAHHGAHHGGLGR